MYCSRCGREIKGSGNYCGHCGQPVGRVPIARKPPREDKPDRAKRNRAKLIVAAGATCIIVLAVAFAVIRLTSGSSDDSGSLDFALISLDDADVAVEDEDDARKVVLGLASMVPVSELESSLGPCRESQVLGSTYYRFSQLHEGVPVYGREIILEADGDGRAKSVVSELADVGNVATAASVDKEAACTTIVDELPDAYLMTAPSLVVYETEEGYKLAYCADVADADMTRRCFVSASDGSFIDFEQVTCDNDVEHDVGSYGMIVYDAKEGEVQSMPERGTDENAQEYTFNIEESGTYYFVDSKGVQLDDSGYYNKELRKAGKIIAEKAGAETYSFEVGGKPLKPVDLGAQRATQSKTKAEKLAKNAMTAYDFYDGVLERKSYNGKGGAITLVANAALKKHGSGNAYSGNMTPYQTSLVFGYENPVKLETVGHEFTHAVETSICAMKYAGESGALKEATSDVFGELIEDYEDDGEMNGSCDWVHGARSMVSPESAETSERGDGSAGYPSSYQQAGLWGDTKKTAFDNGHVHNNSTVISHAAYLMCGSDVEGAALTTSDLARLLLAAFGSCPRNCPFSLFAGVTEMKARNMLGTTKAQRVRAAFEGVGILPIEPVSATPEESNETPQRTIDDLLEERASKLAAKDYAVEYLYRARGFDSDPNFDWVVSDELSDGSVVGTRMADYDGDRNNELLAVVWRNKTVDFDMYEVEGESVRLSATLSETHPIAFPIKGSGSLDIVADGGGTLFMQWWETTDPVATVHDWSVMRIDYDGENFSVSDAATVAGTGQLSLERLKSDMSDLGLRADYVPDQDSSDFTYSSIAELDGTLDLVTRATARVDNESVAEAAYREMQAGSDAWGDAKHLGEFRIGPNVLQAQGQEAEDSARKTADIKAIAEQFMKAWYNDWVFEDGQMVVNQTPVSERCLSFIAEGTDLYSEFSNGENFYAGSGSRLSRSAAMSVAELDIIVGDGNTCTADISFYAAQNTVTQDTFEQMKRHPSHNHDAWTIAFDDAGKIIKIENVSSARGREADDARTQYQWVLNAYRNGLASETQPPESEVNAEAWLAREYNDGRYVYALYDLNEDGSDELLIAVEESLPVLSGEFEVDYRLYDLFTLVDGASVRVLDDEQMISLGYRGYCIPCQDGFIATGGSGGATYHGIDFWHLADRANDKSLVDSVTIDEDSYTFVDGDGNTETLAGSEGLSHYENEVIAKYVPIVDFTWRAL